MAASIPSSNLGHRVFGAATLATGLITLLWHDSNGWHQLRYIVYAAAVAQIFGGAAIQFRFMAKTGAVVFGAAYLIFSLLYVPPIVAAPGVFAPWGDFFEQFSLLTGAAMLYARLSSAWAPETRRAIGRILFGICTVSFTLYQALYLNATASLVPKWLPATQMFWAVTTTVALALAALALLTNRAALLATRLLTLMLVMFGLLVWVPLLVVDPHSHTNWSEIAETFAIAGAAWVLADLLEAYRLRKSVPATI